MKKYLVVSWDSFAEKAHWDLIPAEDEDHAAGAIAVLRGEDVEVVDVFSEEHLTTLQEEFLAASYQDAVAEARTLAQDVVCGECAAVVRVDNAGRLHCECEGIEPIPIELLDEGEYIFEEEME